MSQAYSGVDGTCFFGSIDIDVTGYDLDLKDDGFESTTTADAGWEDHLDSVRSASGNVECFFNATAGAGKNFLAAPVSLFSRAPNVYPQLKLNVGAGKFFLFSAKLKNAKFKSATKEGIKVTFSYQSRGPVTLPTAG